MENEGRREDEDAAVDGVPSSSSPASEQASSGNGGHFEDDAASSSSSSLSYEKVAKQGGMRYTVLDVPSMPMSVLFGIQHVLTMMGATVLVPILLTKAMVRACLPLRIA